MLTAVVGTGAVEAAPLAFGAGSGEAQLAAPARSHRAAQSSTFCPTASGFAGYSGPAVIVDDCRAASGNVSFSAWLSDSGRVDLISLANAGQTEIAALSFKDGTFEIEHQGGGHAYSTYQIGSSFLGDDPFTVSWSSTAETMTWNIDSPSWSGTINVPRGLPASATVFFGGYLQGRGPMGCVCTINVVSLATDGTSGTGGEDEDPDPDPPTPDDFDCGMIPEAVCVFVKPIVNAINGLATILRSILTGIRNLATKIWEMFKVMVIDPDTLGPKWNEIIERLKNSPLGGYPQGAMDTINDMTPQVITSSSGTMCISPEVCLGNALEDLPSGADNAIQAMIYIWAVITYVHMIGATIKTIRR